MIVTNRLKKYLANVAKYISTQTIGDACVKAMIFADQKAACDLQLCNDPCRYLSFLSDCIGPLRYRVDIVKTLKGSSDNISVDMFNRVLTSLRNDPQVIPYRIAREIGLAADRYYGNFQARGKSDFARHFRISSSFAHKGRILSTILRHMKPVNCLELGTAYGMSSMFILSMLKQLNREGTLDTVERTQAQYDLSSQLLKEHFGDQVKCHRGSVQEVLPEVLDMTRSVDFVFHDAGHSFKNYTEDFLLIEPKLSDGAVMLFDDIRWRNDSSADQDPQTYKGWQEVISHPKVIMAAEINRSQGLLLMGTS